MEWKLKRSLLRQLMRAAQTVYPNEFISMVAVSPTDKNLVSEFVILPAEFGRVHSNIRADLMPVDPTIVGTVHSHPSPSTQASGQDKETFSRLGRFHLILGYPFDDACFTAYDSSGRRVRVEIVE